MNFNPDVWPSHKKGEAVRQLILTCLDKPRTKQELAGLFNRSVRQIERHLNRLSSESKIMSNQTGQIVLRVGVGFLLVMIGFCTA